MDMSTYGVCVEIHYHIFCLLYNIFQACLLQMVQSFWQPTLNGDDDDEDNDDCVLHNYYNCIVVSR